MRNRPEPCDTAADAGGPSPASSAGPAGPATLQERLEEARRAMEALEHEVADLIAAQRAPAERTTGEESE